MDARLRKDVPILGGALRVEALRAPLPQAAALQVSAAVNAVLDEPFLPDLFLGRCTGAQVVDVFRGSVEGKPVATAWQSRRDTLPEVAVLAGVTTAEAYQRRGIAGALCGTLVERFDAEGGRLLWLAVSKESVRSVYERLGFRTVSGRLMCRRTGDADLYEGFAPGARVGPRDTDWGDMAALVPLYAWPHECACLDAALDLHSTRFAPAERCVGWFWRTWRTSVMCGGAWRVLENALGWIVASVVARTSSALAPNGWGVDFLWHPDYAYEGRAFVAEELRRLSADPERPAHLSVREGDAVKLRWARAVSDRVCEADPGAAL